MNEKMDIMNFMKFKYEIFMYRLPIIKFQMSFVRSISGKKEHYHFPDAVWSKIIALKLGNNTRKHSSVNVPESSDD